MENELLRTQNCCQHSKEEPANISEAFCRDATMLENHEAVFAAQSTSKPIFNEDFDVCPLPPIIPHLEPEEEEQHVSQSQLIVQETGGESVPCSKSIRSTLPSKDAPSSDNLLYRVVTSTYFDTCIFSLIGLNCLILALELQLRGENVGFAVGYGKTDASAVKNWDAMARIFIWTEYFFIVIFALEVTVRVMVEKCQYFRVVHNYFDVAVVVASLLSVLPGTEFVNGSFARALRISKYIRGLRILSNHQAADSMRMLLKSLQSCVTTLGWSFGILTIVQGVAAMLMTQLVSRYLETSTDPQATVHDVFRYYGTFTKTFLTMHEIFLANWAPSCRVLVNNVSEFYALFFILYRCLLGFAVLNVINAVFVQQTIKVATADQEIMLTQKIRAKEEYARKLRVLFMQLDMSGDGNVTWDEFCDALSDASVKAWMNALELEPGDMRGLFMLLDDGDGQIDIEEFILGASRLKGPAKGIDMAHVMALLKKLDGKVDSLRAKDSSSERPQKHNRATTKVRRTEVS
eukprot:TRINITY_DN18612_c0_g1_i4.p1 TRINITY_DN18612_c0_g1~~TRINITY_DN18612_c0_g1_i4.p1  ORF type:complete len:588 (-),score=81.57 TRINITY_DN18612_c0_g1_i4:101-1654(-)